MKRLAVLYGLIGFAMVQATGFDGDTLVTLADGKLRPIKELQIGDEVVCYNKELHRKFSKIKDIEASTYDTIIEIRTIDGIVLYTSIYERFYLPKKKQWIFAQNLKEGDCLLSSKSKTIAITSVIKIDEPRDLFAIVVDEHHTFLATQGRYLVHNGVMGAHIGFWAAKFAVYIVAHGTIAAIAGSVGLINGPAGYVVGHALEGTFLGPIEYASNVVGLAGGIGLSAITGFI